MDLVRRRDDVPVHRRSRQHRPHAISRVVVEGSLLF
jgi:hypothetical protein